MRRRALRLLLALAALLAAAGAGLVSVRESRQQLRAIDACDAVAHGDVARALRLTEGRTGPSDTGRAAAQCRCRALLAEGDAAACTTLLDPLVDAPQASGWLPDPDLLALLVDARRADGRTAQAAALARRAGRAHPDDPRLFALELETRASVEDEAGVLRELARRVPAEGARAAALRVLLAQRQMRRGDPAAALRTLGDAPPPGAEAMHSLWFDTRMTAFALADDRAGVQRTLDAWRAAGGDPRELRARHALALSIAGLAPAEGEIATLLREALEETLDADDPKLREALAIRLILTLANAQRLEDALAVYDRWHGTLSLEGLSRAEIARAARQQRIAHSGDLERRGTLRFALDAPLREAWLAVSPDVVTAPPDAAWERLALPAEQPLEVVRSEGDAPTRWVLWQQGRVRGSGTVGPLAGETRRVRIAPAAPFAPPAPPRRQRAAADGRRRVALVLLDCGDWRLAGYLRARGELPVLGALLGAGHRAVLDSDPPLTAAALEALVWPTRRGDASLLGLVHRMGVELAGLASVGDNPFDALSWVLPETPDLFETIGAGERAAANLLLAHGGIRAGRHGEVSGPHGARQRLAIGSAARDLDADERARFPGLAQLTDERDRLYVRTIAAEIDAALGLVRAGELDLVAVRVEPLDILTHAHFSDTVADGQDDGRGLLYDVYRYLDARLLEFDAALDADDVLIVMSDHGIRTAMEHSRHAMFVAVGGGLPVGRAPGSPALRGVSRVVADLLGVRTDWPDTGVAPWPTPQLAQGAAAAGPGGDRQSR